MRLGAVETPRAGLGLRLDQRPLQHQPRLSPFARRLIPLIADDGREAHDRPEAQRRPVAQIDLQPDGAIAGLPQMVGQPVDHLARQVLPLKVGVDDEHRNPAHVGLRRAVEEVEVADRLTAVARAQRLQDVYKRQAQGIYLMPQGSATAGQRLVTYETYQFVRGLAWLPDGSGFVYSVEELDDSFTATRANVFVYRFSNGQPCLLYTSRCV